MPNIEFAVAHSLLTPGGNVDLNTATGRRYMIDPSDYKIVPALRVTQDNISQADGSVLHPRWKTGLVAQMKVLYYVKADYASDESEEQAADEPACGQVLREMHEDLVQALNSIRKLTGAAQRLQWQPTGYGDTRMLDQIQLLSWPDPTYDLEGDEASVTFSVESPFPYALDSTEQSLAIADGATGVVANLGNAPFSPVIIVHGPTDPTWTITNLDDVDAAGTPLEIAYDETRPGASAIPSSHTGEIDCFRGTIYEDGDGPSLIAGIDPTVTDFFHINRGNNRIQPVGCDITVLWNNSWC